MYNWWTLEFIISHYNDVIMGTIASQITSLAIVYPIFYSETDQRKHQSSASLAFVWGIHRDRGIPRTNGQLRGKCFHLMTSSWLVYFHFLWRQHAALYPPINTSRPRQNGCHLSNDTFKCIFLNKNVGFQLKFCSLGSNWQYISIGSDNVLAPTMWQAIIWIIDG